MTRLTTKLAAFAIAAAAFAANPPLSSDASAKPMGGGFGGGGFKSSAVFKAAPIINKGPIFKAPVNILKPIKVVTPVFPIKPLPPICKGPGCGPKPGHHHHHGKFWLLGGVTILASAYDGCGYEYYKWKSTDSAVWYAKYAECRGWE